MNTFMEYKYVSLEDSFMRQAYEMAKTLYKVKSWNIKTTTVAIIVQKGKVISVGICADGQHAIQGYCGRLEESGLPYSSCEFCKEEQHAERKALKAAYDKDLIDAIIYVYGHYKLCISCVKALNERGIYECVLLENSHILFDRHHPSTVLGTPNQFLI